jgi:hypothetical protein
MLCFVQPPNKLPRHQGRSEHAPEVWRARIVLMWAQWARVTAIARATGKTKRTAYRWRDRYLALGAARTRRHASRTQAASDGGGD